MTNCVIIRLWGSLLSLMLDKINLLVHYNFHHQFLANFIICIICELIIEYSFKMEEKSVFKTCFYMDSKRPLAKMHTQSCPPNFYIKMEMEREILLTFPRSWTSKLQTLKT